jgi:hypothetical protein
MFRGFLTILGRVGFVNRRSHRGSPNLKFSAPPLRSLRLCGECFQNLIHRRDAEVAETTQRKPEIRTTSHHSARPSGRACIRIWFKHTRPSLTVGQLTRLRAGKLHATNPAQSAYNSALVIRPSAKFSSTFRHAASAKVQRKRFRFGRSRWRSCLRAMRCPDAAGNAFLSLVREPAW